MLSENLLKNQMGKYNLRPNKLLGQNFLVDRGVLEKIIAAADLSKNDVVLEVGPGLGILTLELAKHAGQVVAVEKDKKMAGVVRNVLKDRNVRNVEIVEGDILKILDLSVIPAKAGIQDSGFRIKSGMTIIPRENYKLVANIPYYLTARLIRKFLESDSPPTEMILMIQKEVAQRICACPPLAAPSGVGRRAKPPEMSLLAVATQFYAEPKIISYVSKNSFWPSPKVDSAIIKITPWATLIRESHTDDTDNIVRVGASALTKPKGRSRAFCVQFFRVVKAGFAHPRKQLINNLSAGLKIDRTKIAAALKKIGLTPEQRAETLSVDDWIKLSDSLKL